MKYLKKLSVKNIIISLLTGAFFAASMTDIAYPASSTGSPNGERTPYREGVVHYDGLVYRDGVISGHPIAPRGGTAYEDVFSRPGDLINNVQNSQSRFLGTYVVVSLVSFAILTALTFLWKKIENPKPS